MALRDLNSTLKEHLLENKEFILAHLIKFEKPQLGPETSVEATDYVYMTDAPFPLTLDSQVYVPSNVLQLGSVRENIAAKSGTMTLKLAASALGTSFIDQLTFTSQYIQSNYSWSVQGFKEGDIVTFTPAGDGSVLNYAHRNLEFRIDSIQESSEGLHNRVYGTVLSSGVAGSLSAETTKTYKITTSNPQLNAMLLPRTEPGYASYVHRRITIYRAYIDPETGEFIGNPDRLLNDNNGVALNNPFILFKGNISNCTLTENVTNGSTIQWTLTDHWGDFIRRNGRKTSDGQHRKLDAFGNSVLSSLDNPGYAYDYGFEHSEKSINAMTQYTRKEQRTGKDWSSNSVKKLFGGKKTVTYWVDVEEPVELNFNLAAKYIPVVYGVRKVKGTPFFVDTDNGDGQYVYQAIALAEGPIAGLYDIHVEGDTILCTDGVDYGRRREASESTAICYGNAEMGNILSGTSTISFTGSKKFSASSHLGESPDLEFRSKKLNTVGSTLYNSIEADSSYGQQTSKAYKGVGANQSFVVKQPQEIIFDMHVGASDQRASDRLAKISQQGGFKIQNDYYSGSTGRPSPAYWTPLHRALDTAYLVTRTKITADSQNLPDLEYVIKGKFVNCFNYDGSFQPYAGSSNLAVWDRNDQVKAYRTDGVELGGPYRVAEIFDVDKHRADKVRKTSDTGIGVSSRFTVRNPVELLEDIGSVEKLYFVNTTKHTNTNANRVYCYTYRATGAKGLGTAITVQPIVATVTQVRNAAEDGDTVNKMTVSFADGSYWDTMVLANGDAYQSFEFKNTTTGRMYNTRVTGQTGTSGDISGSGTHSQTLDLERWPSYEVWEDIDNDITAGQTVQVIISDLVVAPNSQSLASVNVGEKVVLTTGDFSQTVRLVDLNYTQGSSRNYLALSDNAITIQSSSTVDSVENDLSSDLRVTLNPAMQLLDYLTSYRYGKGLSIDRDIDLPSFLQAARDCDTRSHVTIQVDSVGDIEVGDTLVYEHSGTTHWVGTVSEISNSISFDGDTFYMVTFENCSGKLIRRALPGQSYIDGELVYDGSEIRRVTTNFTTTTSSSKKATTRDSMRANSASLWTTGSASHEPFSIECKERTTFGRFLRPWVDKRKEYWAQGTVANPVIKQWTGVDFTGSGYSLYDCDDVKYWALQGWNDPGQYNVTRHQCSMAIDTSESLFDNVNAILAQFSGLLSYTNGKYSLAVKKACPDTLDGITIDDVAYTPAEIHRDDIIGSLKVEGKPVKDTFNTVTTRVNDVSQKFNSTDITFFNSDYLAEDRGIPKSANIAYPGINNYFNARINIQQELDRSRSGLTISFKTKPQAILLKAGDFIRLTHPEYGFTNKTFRITSLSLEYTGLVQISATEHDASTYILKGVNRGTEVLTGTDDSGRVPVKIENPPIVATTTNDDDETIIDVANASKTLPQKVILNWSHTAEYDPAFFMVEVWRHPSAAEGDDGNGNTILDVEGIATKIGTTSGTEFTDHHGLTETNLDYYYYLRYIATGKGVKTGDMTKVFSDFTDAIVVDLTPLDAAHLNYVADGGPTIESLKPATAGADATQAAINAGIEVNNDAGGFTINGAGHIKSDGRINEEVNSADEAGFFLGYNSTSEEYTFGIGDQDTGLVWDGDELSVTGNIDATTMTLAESIEIGSTNLDDAVNASLDLADTASQVNRGLALLLNQDADGDGNSGEASLVGVDKDGNPNYNTDGFIVWNGIKEIVPHDTYDNITVLTHVAGKKGFIAFDVLKSKPFNLGSYGYSNIAFVWKEGDQWYYDDNSATPVSFSYSSLFGSITTPVDTTSQTARILALGYLQTTSADTDSISKGGLFGEPVDIELASMPSDEINSGTIAGIKVTSNSIESTNFATGEAGSGFKIGSDGALEASDGTFRGNITADTLSLADSVTIGNDNLDSTLVSNAAAGAVALAQAQEMGSKTDNLIHTPVFTETTTFQGSWSGGATEVVDLSEETNDAEFPDGYEYALKLDERDAYEISNIIPVVPGETFYFSVWVNAEFATRDVSFGYRKYNNGAAVSSWYKAATITAGTTGWKHLTGSLEVASTEMSAMIPWIQIDWDSNNQSHPASPGVAYFNGFRLSRSAQGNLGGITIASTKLYQGTGTFNNDNTAFYLDNQGNFSLKDKLSYDIDGGDDSSGLLTVSGDIDATSLTLASGISIAETNLDSTVQNKLGLANTAAQPGDIPANQFSARMSWSFDTGLNGWTGTGATVNHNGQGYIEVISSGTDPIITSPDNLNLSGGLDALIIARIKRTAGSGWHGALYYSTNEREGYTNHGFSEDFKKTISDPTSGSNSDWMLVQWDMTDLTNGDDDWIDNQIKQIRIDLGNTSADQFYVDWVAVGSTGAVPMGDGAYLESGAVGGITIERQKLYQGAGNHNNADTGFYLDNSGNFSLQNKLSFDGTDLTVSGDITAENLTLEEDATVTGTLSADNIAIDDVMLDTLNGDLILKREGIGASRFATDAKLLMNPVSQTGNVNRWGGYDDYGNVVNTINDETTVSYDSTEKALKLATTNDNQAIRCEGWPVNHNNIYKITFSIKSSANQGLWYVGATQSSTLIESQTMNSGHNGQTNMIFPAWYNYNRTEYTTNSDGSTTGNFYFRSGSSTSYIEMSVYMLGNNVSIDDVPQHVGSGGNPYVKLNADAKFAGLRILNWDNEDSPKDVFVKNLSVTEVTPFPIVAQNIETANLSAISSDLGSITAGSLAIGDNDEFEVTNAGALTATGATITGAITATSGSFTGNITANSLVIGVPQAVLDDVPTANLGNMNVAKLGRTIVAFPDERDDGTNIVGEIQIKAGKIRLSNSLVKTQTSDMTDLLTPFEGSTRTGTFFIVSGAQTPWNATGGSGGRFGATAHFNANNQMNLFIAVYDNGWYAVPNSGSDVSFTPATTDYLIAVGKRPTTSDGITLNFTSPLVNEEALENGHSLLEDGVTLTSGGITLSDGGSIKGGQSGFDTGSDGFFLGYDTDAYKFSIGDVDGDKLTWDGSDLAITGEITATSGTFTGTVNASSGTFTGAVNASSGTFTGDVSTTAKFTAGNVGLDGTSGDTDTIRIYAGDSTPSDALFKVTDGGAVTATSGTIGSLTLASDKVTIGTSTTHGNANAKFYADDSGNFGLGDKLTFDGSALSVNGAVTATSGSFGGITIANSKIYTGTGTFGNSNTGFYLDNTGDFSLSDKFKFDISASTLTVDGTIEADEFSTIEGKPVPEITVGTKLQSQATLSPRVVIFGGDPVFYAALEDNTRIYLNNVLVATVNKGASSTIAAADLDNGDIIHSTKPVSLRQNGSPLPTLSATGQFFVTTNRKDYAYLHFGIYSPYADGQIKYFNFDSANPEDANEDSLIDWSDNNAYDASTNPNGWKTKALTQGSVAELTIDRPSSTLQGYQWFQADTPVVITSASSHNSTWFGGTLQDVKLLKEVSREVLSYDEGNQIKYNPSNTGTIENTNHDTATSWRYSRSTGDLLFAHSDQGDGDGGDGVQGIPWKMCGDTYVIDHGLRSYQIATIEPSIISAYYWTGTAWTLYKTHDFSTASRSSFAAHTEGDSDDHGVDSNSFIGQGVADKPWRFIGTGRFALRVNTPSAGWNTDGYDDDEYFVLGYDSNLRSQETIRVGQLIAEDISADAITGEKILSTTNIKVGPSGSEQVGLDGSGTGDSAVRIYAGDTTPASAPFRVTDDGSLTATGATISGAITATSLTIGESASVSGLSSTDVSGLGTAATTDSTAYATSAQGTTADNALQPGGNLTGSINGLPVGDSYKETTKGLQLPTANQVLPGAHDDEWTLGDVSGNRGIWATNGGADENEIVFEQGPHGVKTRVWKSVNEDIDYPSQTGADDGDDGDGGFYNTTKWDIGSDDDAVFRFSVFVRQEDTDGSMYFGGWNWNASNNNIGFPKHDGSESTDDNQYFYSGDLPTQGEWYLAVGYFQMNNDDDKNSGLGGLYQVSTGFKKQSWNDLMFNSNATKFSFRTYQYYANDTDDGTVARWAHPRVEKMRTNTPSIEQLIAGNTVVHTTSAEKALRTITSADGSTNITLTPNADTDDTTNNDNGEIKVSAGVYKFGDNDVREVATEATLATPFEGGLYPEFPGNNFYIISGDTGTVTYRVVVGETVLGRFQTLTGSNIGAGLFVAIFDPANEQWYAVNNDNDREAFTPLSTDHVVAIGHKNSTTGGFQTLRSLIPFVNDPESDQTEPTLTGGVSITGGGVTINGGGSIKGGQGAYNSGTGFFLGYDTDDYKFSIGNSGAGEKSLTWDGSDLTIRGDITADSLTLSSGVTIGTGSLSGTISDSNLPSTALNENVTTTSLGLGTAATTDSTAYATAAQGSTADSASQVNVGLALITNKHKNSSNVLSDNEGDALLVGVDKTGTPVVSQNGFIQWEGSKITVETEQYNDSNTTILTILTGSPNKKGFIIFDTAKNNDFTVNAVAMDVAFAWKIGNQWYYDNNTNDNTGTTFTPAASYVALGYLETTTADLITKGGLFGHPVPLDQAAFPGDVVQSGTIGGIKIDNEKLYAGNGNFFNSDTGFYLKNDGDFSLSNKLKFDESADTLTVDGNITAQSLTLDAGITIGTTNLPEEVLNENVGPGGTHNKDPYFEKSSWFDNTGSAALGSEHPTSSIITNATGLPTGRSTHFRSLDNDDANEDFFSELMPITEGKLYKLTVWAKQSGDRHNYLLVDFRNAAGERINNGSVQAGETSSDADEPIHNSTGWESVGTYHYWKVANTEFSSDWKKYEMIMGGPDGYTFSYGTDSNGRDRNPVAFRVGALVTRDGSTNSTVDIAEYTVTELDVNTVHTSDATNTLNYNSDFRIRDSFGKPDGLAPVYHSTDPDNIQYESANSHRVVLQNDNDSTIGMAFPAFRVNPDCEYTINVRAKVTGSSNKGTGFYIRMNEYDSELGSGKTHVAHSSSVTNPGYVQEDTRQITNLHENGPITTSFDLYTETYKPTSSAKWVSLLILNWTGMGTEGLVIEYARVTENTLNKTRGTIGGITVSDSKLYAGTGTFNNANTGFYLDNSGNFSLKDLLSFNEDTEELNVKGAVVAESLTLNSDVKIDGSNLNAESIDGSHIKSDTVIEAYNVYPSGHASAGEINPATYAALDGEDDEFRIYAGDYTPTLAPFSVSKDGTVIARSLKLYKDTGELYFDPNGGLGLAALTQVASFLSNRVHTFSKNFVSNIAYSASDFRTYEDITVVENVNLDVNAKINTSTMYGYGLFSVYDSISGRQGTSYIYTKIGGWEAGDTGTGPLSAPPHDTQGWPTGSGTITISTNDFKTESYAPGGTLYSFPTTDNRKTNPSGNQVSFYDGELIRLDMAWVPYANFTSTRIVNVTGAKLATGVDYTDTEVFTSSNNNFWRQGQYLQSSMYLRICKDFPNTNDTFGFTISTPDGYKNFQYSGGKIGGSRVNVLQEAYDSIPEKIKIRVNRIDPNGAVSYPIDETNSINSSSGTKTAGDMLELKKASLSTCFTVGAAIAADEFALNLSTRDNIISTNPSDNTFGLTYDGSGSARLTVRPGAGCVDDSGFIKVEASTANINAGTYRYTTAIDQTTPPGGMPFDWMSFPTLTDTVLTWGIPTTGAGFQMSDDQASQEDDVPANKIVYGSSERITVTGSLTNVNDKPLRVNTKVQCEGNVTAYYSDERLKDRVGNIDNAIDKIKKLEGFIYKENALAKSYGFDNEKNQVGLSAQQVQSVLPEAVELAPFDYKDLENGEIISKSGENYLTLDYSKVVPLLIEAIKEQQEQIEILTEKIEKLT